MNVAKAVQMLTWRLAMGEPDCKVPASRMPLSEWSAWATNHYVPLGSQLSGMDLTRPPNFQFQLG